MAGEVVIAVLTTLRWSHAATYDQMAATVRVAATQGIGIETGVNDEQAAGMPA